jgi:hypothetical protein
MKKNLENTDKLVRLSFPTTNSIGGLAHLRPGETKTFITEPLQVGGIARVLRLGDHPNVKLVSVKVGGDKKEFLEKKIGDGFAVSISQQIMVTVKNEDEGRILWVHPLFSVEIDYGTGSSNNGLISAGVPSEERGFFTIERGATDTICVQASFHSRPRRVFIHTYNSDEQSLVVLDLKVGKNSQLVGFGPISSSHFSERLSPQLRFDAMTSSQCFSVILKNQGPTPIFFFAELEVERLGNDDEQAPQRSRRSSKKFTPSGTAKRGKLFAKEMAQP